MPAPNKIKGNAFERKVAEIFSEVTGTSFQRVPTSGAYIGGKNAHRIETLSENQILLARGDLIPSDEYKKCVFECKSYNEFDFHKLWSSSKKLDGWIDQVQIDHNLSNSMFYCVIFKISRRGQWICYEEGNVPATDKAFHRYYHVKSKTWFCIEEFNAAWVERNKETLYTLSN